MKASPIWASFSSGEISPLLMGRVDLQKYSSGCKTLENYIVHTHGPASRRPGTRFISETKVSATKSRLIPFEFSNIQAYTLEFGNQYARFYKDRGVIVSAPSTPYEIEHPYAEADLPLIRYLQSADVMFMAHPNHAPRKLERTGHTAWTLKVMEFVNGPYLTQNVEETKLITCVSGAVIPQVAITGAVASGGLIQIIATAHGLENNDYTQIANVVGVECDGTWQVTRIDANNFTLNGSVFAGTFVSGGTSRKLTLITATGHTPFVAGHEGAHWGVYLSAGTAGAADNFGWLRVRKYLSTSTVMGEIVSAIAPSTYKWREGAWSDHRGWPYTLAFFEQRLVFAGSDAKPVTVWGSKIGNYDTHTPGVLDDDAFTYTLPDSNPIAWIRGDTNLMVGTMAAEWRLTSSSESAAPLSPTNVKAKRDSYYGSNQAMPQAVGDTVLFVQRYGRKVRELVFDWAANKTASQDITIMSEHITAPEIVETAYQRSPDQILWCVRSDGQLAGCTYERQQEVVGWHRHSTQGFFESVATIPGPTQDEVWVIVRRVINGVEKRFVELLEDRDFGSDQADCFFVDCGLTYDGIPITVIPGLGHLEGETVSILSDGAVVANQVVVSGSVTLLTAGSVNHVGLPYVSTLAPVRPEAGAQDGTAQGKTKRVHGVVVRLYRSLGMKVGEGPGHMDTLPFRHGYDVMDAPPPLFTGDFPVAFDGDYGPDGYVVITQDLPLPCTVLCVCPRLTTMDDWVEGT